MENTSGQGENTQIPEEIDRWNWGAFFLNAIWGVGNKTYLALLALIPIINIFVIIALGFNGNKWAWRNKRWNSVEHFKSVQQKWTYAGYAACAIYLFVFIKGLYEIFFT